MNTEPTIIFLGTGEICVASSTHLETQTPALTFRRLKTPVEPGSLLEAGKHEVEDFLSIVVVPTRPAAEVLFTATKAILARFPEIEGEKPTDAKTVADLLEQLATMRKAGDALAHYLRPPPIPAEAPTELDWLLAAWEEAKS